MEPQQFSNPPQPIVPSKPKRKKLAIFLIVTSIINLPVMIVLDATMNFMFGESIGAAHSLIHSLINSLFFLFGAVSIIGSPIAFIVGIVLLASRPKEQ